MVLQNVATMSIKRRVSKRTRPALLVPGVASGVLGAPRKGRGGGGSALVVWSSGGETPNTGS